MIRYAALLYSAYIIHSLHPAITSTPPNGSSSRSPHMMDPTTTGLGVSIVQMQGRKFRYELNAMAVTEDLFVD